MLSAATAGTGITPAHWHGFVAVGGLLVLWLVRRLRVSMAAQRELLRLHAQHTR